MSSSPSAGSGMLPQGLIMGRRYAVERILGKGGMGAVYLVRDLNLGSRYCALKELLDHSHTEAERAEAISRFAAEAETLAALSHPSIPQVYDRFAEQGRYYLVMEFVEGIDLGRVLTTHLQRHGRALPEAEVFRWAIHLCDVLEYLHQHTPPVVHRDLKPANLILVKGGRIKLVDFGIVKRSATAGGTVIGTQGYAPPEQYRGETGPQSDLYALGASLHHLLTGRDPQRQAPFDFPPLLTLAPTVHPSLAALVTSLLATDPQGRPITAGAVRDGLLEIAPSLGQDRTRSVDLRVEAVILSELTADMGLPSAPDPTAASPAPPKAVRPGLDLLRWTLEQAVSLEEAGELCGALSQYQQAIHLAADYPRIAEQLNLIIQDLSARQGVLSQGPPLVKPPTEPVSGRSPANLMQPPPPPQPQIQPRLQPWAQPLPQPQLRLHPWAQPPPQPQVQVQLQSRVYPSVMRPVMPTVEESLPPARRAGAITAAEARWLAESGSLGSWGRGVQALLFSPDGDSLLAGTGDGRCLSWQPSRGGVPRVLYQHLGTPVRALAAHPDSVHIAAAGMDATVRIRAISTGEIVREFGGHKAPVESLNFSPDGSLLASGSTDGEVRLWYFTDGKEIHSLGGHGRGSALAFMPDGSGLAVTAPDALRIWKVPSGRLIRSLKAHMALAAVAVHPDSAWLASGAGDGTIHVWQLQEGKCVATLSRHAAKVNSLLFSPDGSLLISASADRTIWLWSVQNWAPLLKLTAHLYPVQLVAVTTDGGLLSSSSDEGVKLWSLKAK